MRKEDLNCKVQYASRQSLLGDTTEKTLETEGEYNPEDKILRFKENIGDENNVIEVETAFHFFDSHIEVYRDGEMTFDFDQRKDTSSMYNTPYGAMRMVIHTKELASSINDTKGSAYMEYNIFFDKDTKSDCTYGIKFEVV